MNKINASAFLAPAMIVPAISLAGTRSRWVRQWKSGNGRQRVGYDQLGRAAHPAWTVRGRWQVLLPGVVHYCFDITGTAYSTRLCFASVSTVGLFLRMRRAKATRGNLARIVMRRRICCAPKRKARTAAGFLLLSTFVVVATHRDAHARDLNTDPRLSVLLRTFLVVLAPRLVMMVLLNNHGRSVVMLFPAIAMLITDHLDMQQAVIDVRNAIGKGSCLGCAHEQARSTSQKRKRKCFHIHSSLVCSCALFLTESATVPATTHANSNASSAMTAAVSTPVNGASVATLGLSVLRANYTLRTVALPLIVLRTEVGRPLRYSVRRIGICSSRSEQYGCADGQYDSKTFHRFDSCMCLIGNSLRYFRHADRTKSPHLWTCHDSQWP